MNRRGPDGVSPTRRLSNSMRSGRSPGALRELSPLDTDALEPLIQLVADPAS
jgi:hypothetical protein